ncbi:MAG: hypothetical protein S4CHLAM37_11440 [Chlamydiia bacterium]|nr:hypothetical protein [Chlamydiia bacterium]
MLELNPFRKNKVNLEDYDYQKDIQNRLTMAKLTSEDLVVLEEILYSPPTIAISELAQDLVIEESDLSKVLQKLSTTGLFQIKGVTIHLHKETRKYFEAQIQKFQDGFVPGMEYLQSLLRKVPFHVLLSWYPIPRTSNNIFDSLIEKYLVTPQVFQRYLMELNFGNPKISGIVEDVFNSPDFMVLGKDLKEKYEMGDEEFEEVLLHLEFNFICCLVYRKIDGKWQQIVSPFHEWREYLRFLRDSKPSPIEDTKDIKVVRDGDFPFISDMTSLLNLCKTTPIPLKLDENERWVPDKTALKKLTKIVKGISDTNELTSYTSLLIQKLLFLKLARVENSALSMNDGCDEWLSLSVENRALASYKHTLTRLEYENFSAEVATERHIREIEKTISNVIHLGWVEYDEFMKGISASISEDSKIILKKVGKGWRYSLPQYTDEESRLIKRTILEWLFEAGLVSIGTYNGKDCFRVTAFGQSIFS